GRIRFEVTDGAGKPAAAALGVIVVDEAVYALQDLQPGLEKVYFTLQEELLKPQVQVKYQPAENLNMLVRQPVLPAPKQQIARVLLTAVQPPPPPRWEVAPGLQRKHQYETQVMQIGWAVFNYAWNHEQAMPYDKAGADILPDVLRAGLVNDAMLKGPFGGRLSLVELAHSEKDFTLDHLARAITRQRLEQLSAALVTYTEANKQQWFKDGRWTLPAVALVEAAKRQGLDFHVLQDAWGQAFKLAHYSSKRDNKTGHGQFDHYDIVSAGPD